MKRRTRVLRLPLGGFALLLFAVSLLFGLPAPVQAERINMATPSRGLFEFPVVVAMRQGFFKSEASTWTKFRCNRPSASKP
jgi:hypothetical protein